MVAGAAFVYTVTVTNTGDQDARDVRITDTLDEGAIARRLPDGCSLSAQTVTCGGPGLTVAPGESVTYEIPVTMDPALPDGTNVTNRAQVSATGARGDSTRLISQTRALADLEIVKTAPATANADGPITYSLRVTNHGPSQAMDVTVRDAVDGDRAAITGRPAECAGEGPTLTCPLGTLAPNTSRTFRLTVTPEVPGLIENCATVDAGGREENVADNRSCASTHVEPA
ncbi:DUF11 domain-containing protein, partial [Nonomuraea sp. K274]|nr:DUF11 domain-containing protein [Nonomuraea cypriaca]